MFKKLKEGQSGGSPNSRGDSEPRCGHQGWPGQILKSLVVKGGGAGSAATAMGSSNQRAIPTGGVGGEDGGHEPRASAVVWTGDMLS